MGRKKKTKRFAEVRALPNVIEPSWEEAIQGGFAYKGKWAGWFGNSNPITLELGCGKGEYTLALAQRFPHRNFIGVDIKGARIWRGAKTAYESGFPNICFLRTRIEFISSFFGRKEVEEIWITFPDPQPRKSRAKKRLTSPQFINRYSSFLKEGGNIHLKTDSLPLHEYTLEMIAQGGHSLTACTGSVYENGMTAIPAENREILSSVHTFYEKKFIAEGKKITYLSFQLNERIGKE